MFDSIMLPQHFIQGSQLMGNVSRDDISYILLKLFGGSVVSDTNPRVCEDLFYIQNQDVGRLLIHTDYRSCQTISNF